MNYTFEFFVNETVDPTREYFNFDGYRPGAHMKLGYSGPAIATDDNEALNRLFETFNVNHPRDYKNRSMSVGDVVRLKDETGTLHSYACEKIGWKQLDSFNPDDKNPAWMDWDTYQKNEKVHRAGTK